MVKFETVYNILSLAYAKLLRTLIVKAVQDPEEQWDDFVLQLLDKFFNYSA